MIFGGQKGAALLFTRECILETINAQFQSLFCQNSYIYTMTVYMILGLQGCACAACPLA